MHRNRIAVLILALASLGIVGCQTTAQKVTATSIELPPMGMPDHPAGTSWMYTNGSKTGSITLLSKDAERLTVRSVTGCTYTRASDSMFAPSSAWKDCAWGSGTAKVAEKGGSLSPIQTGARQSWTWNGSNSRGWTFDGARDCEAVGAERVTLAAGAFDTFKIVCVDTWTGGGRRELTLYIAPDLGAPVLFILSSGYGGTSRWEYVSGPHKAESS